MVKKGFTTWKKQHETVMKVLGRTVQMIGVNCMDLERLGVPNFEICRDIFAHNCYYSAEKLFRDVPEFAPQISLEEGSRRVFESMREQERIPRSESGGWEDHIIERVGKMRNTVSP